MASETRSVAIVRHRHRRRRPVKCACNKGDLAFPTKGTFSIHMHEPYIDSSRSNQRPVRIPLEVSSPDAVVLVPETEQDAHDVVSSVLSETRPQPFSAATAFLSKTTRKSFQHSHHHVTPSQRSPHQERNNERAVPVPTDHRRVRGSSPLLSSPPLALLRFVLRAFFFFFASPSLSLSLSLPFYNLLLIKLTALAI